MLLWRKQPVASFLMSSASSLPLCTCRLEFQEAKSSYALSMFQFLFYPGFQFSLAIHSLLNQWNAYFVGKVLPILPQKETKLLTNSKATLQETTRDFYLLYPVAFLCPLPLTRLAARGTPASVLLHFFPPLLCLLCSKYKFPCLKHQLSFQMFPDHVQKARIIQQPYQMNKAYLKPLQVSMS